MLWHSDLNFHIKMQFNSIANVILRIVNVHSENAHRAPAIFVRAAGKLISGG